MDMIKIAFTFAAALGFAGCMGTAAAGEAPDVLVKRISTEVMDAAKADKEIQSGNQKRVLDLVDAKILPYVDFQRMTSLAAGRFWREATPNQQKQLTAEFRSLLVFTYSGAISSIKNQNLEFPPLRANQDAAGGVEVQTRVVQARGEAIQLNYRLEKQASGWKIFDMNIMGAWLIETYKGNFSAEIGKGGMDGLIKTLAEKNKKLSDGLSKPAKLTLRRRIGVQIVETDERIAHGSASAG